MIPGSLRWESLGFFITEDFAVAMVFCRDLFLPGSFSFINMLNGQFSRFGDTIYAQGCALGLSRIRFVDALLIASSMGIYCKSKNLAMEYAGCPVDLWICG